MPGRPYVILLGAVVFLLLVRIVFFRGEDLSEFEMPETFPFQCMACDHEWDTPIQDTTGWYPDRMANDRYPVKCLDCGKRSALLKRNCMGCKEKYLPEPDVWRNNADPQAPAMLPEICPHCNRDVLTWQPR